MNKSPKITRRWTIQRGKQVFGVSLYRGLLFRRGVGERKNKQTENNNDNNKSVMMVNDSRHTQRPYCLSTVSLSESLFLVDARRVIVVTIFFLFSYERGDNLPSSGVLRSTWVTYRGFRFQFWSDVGVREMSRSLGVIRSISDSLLHRRSYPPAILLCL